LIILTESLKNVVKGILKPIKYAAKTKKNEIWAADNWVV
jgi:hypothetical protein